MHTIKRYANGRFYDTEKKGFIRRDEIAEMMAAEKDFKIIDTRTGDDITGEIRERILAAEAGKQAKGSKGKQDRVEAGRSAETGEEAGLEGSFFEFLRRSRDSLYQWGRKYASRSQELLAESWQELDRRINRLVAEKKMSESEGRDLKEQIFRQSEGLRNWLGNRVDKAVKDIIRKENLAAGEELEVMEKRIEELEKRIRNLEEKPGGRQ